ncbi:MAG: hypothetical protein H0X34_03075 [Chthoniobacterales bacterium]|nr:hypothetical protein [Chthoniobacterales bacterium]
MIQAQRDTLYEQRDGRERHTHHEQRYPILGNGSFTQFFDAATAGSATIVNHGGAVPGSSGASATFFNGTSSAGNGTFINTATPGATAGYIYFVDSSTAAEGTFTNDGFISFSGSSTAANGIFTNGQGQIAFGASTTAGNGIFTCKGSETSGVEGSVIFFGGTADHATVTVEGGAVSGAGGASIQFDGSATAAAGNFTINGGAISSADGGVAVFDGTTQGGSATFTINGGAVSGANGGRVIFDSDADGKQNCSAANATLIANGGLNGGSGSVIEFQGNSSGGASRIKLFWNGGLDISNRSTILTVTIGSLEGSGIVFLGGNGLSVGGTNLDTTFSGVLQDGGSAGGTGDSLTKVGSGKLTLSGANT